MTNATLTKQDRSILDVLQSDGKISTNALAEKTGMSPSPCWRRVRKLEEIGVIDRYVALVNPKKIDLNARAYVHVSLMDHTEDTIQIFDRFVQTEPQILESCSVTGADDFLLLVVAKDPEALEHFLMKRLLRLGVVRSSTTHFVLRQTKHTTALPL